MKGELPSTEEGWKREDEAHVTRLLIRNEVESAKGGTIEGTSVFGKVDEFGSETHAEFTAVRMVE